MDVDKGGVRSGYLMNTVAELLSQFGSILASAALGAAGIHWIFKTNVDVFVSRKQRG